MEQSNDLESNDGKGRITISIDGKPIVTKEYISRFTPLDPEEASLLRIPAFLPFGFCIPHAEEIANWKNVVDTYNESETRNIMSTNLLPVQPVASKTFTMRDLPVTRANIDSALETLWMTQRFNPTFMMMSTAHVAASEPHDHEKLSKEMLEWLHGGLDDVEEVLKKLPLDTYHNPATGQVMHVYGSTYLPSGVVVFGSVAIDQVTK